MTILQGIRSIVPIEKPDDFASRAVDVGGRTSESDDGMSVNDY